MKVKPFFEQSQNELVSLMERVRASEAPVFQDDDFKQRVLELGERMIWTHSELHKDVENQGGLSDALVMKFVVILKDFMNARYLGRLCRPGGVAERLAADLSSVVDDTELPDDARITAGSYLTSLAGELATDEKEEGSIYIEQMEMYMDFYKKNKETDDAQPE